MAQQTRRKPRGVEVARKQRAAMRRQQTPPVRPRAGGPFDRRISRRPGDGRGGRQRHER